MGPRALLFLIVAPALAFGQTPSAGLLTASPTQVGQAKCASTSTTDDVTLSWTIDTTKTTRSATASDKYRVAVYADGTTCPVPSSAPGATASNVVVSDVGAAGNSQSAAVTFAAMASAGTVTCATGSLSDAAKVLCVYLVDSAGAAQGTAAGATGTFLFQLARPPPPVLDSVGPASSALIVNFHAGTPTGLDTATSARYRVDVRLAGALVASYADATSGARFGGLVDGTVYTVDVVALSPGGNESLPSNSLTQAPKFFADFWQAYQGAGGREQGGCGGGAGALSLLALLPLALRRRRP